jgi:hypothetical protein
VAPDVQHEKTLCLVSIINASGPFHTIVGDPLQRSKPTAYRAIHFTRQDMKCFMKVIEFVEGKRGRTD